MKNFTFLNNWIPSRSRAVQDVQDIEAAARFLTNLQGFEELGERTPGGMQITNEIIGTPFLCSPAFNLAGTKIDRVIIGAFRSGIEYNFVDYIHLQMLTDPYTEIPVDQTLVGPEVVTVTGPGMIIYEIVWDGAASPIITPVFNPGFALPPNDDTTRHVILAYTDLGTDGNLLYLRQTQVGIIKEYFHKCCPAGPVPGICPEDCADCSPFLPITVTIAGFTGGCSDFNGAYSLSSIAGATDGCWHFMGGSAVTCTPPPGETAFNCPVGSPFPKYRHGSGVDDPIIGAMCCGGLWELHIYVSTTNLNDCQGLRTARWFATPDPFKSGCIPLTTDWILETTTNIFPCSNTSCPGCTNCCDLGDCFQCVSQGTCITT